MDTAYARLSQPGGQGGHLTGPTPEADYSIHAVLVVPVLRGGCGFDKELLF